MAGAESKTGHLLVPPTIQTFLYDADGNLTNDYVWRYSWSAENRLLTMETVAATATNGMRRLEFTYDFEGRRIRKIVRSGHDGTSYTTTDDTKFLYDGWNLLSEVNMGTGSVIRGYLWGNDISGRLDGAGGVNGLVSVKDTADGTHFYSYDGNGNVTGLVKSDGTISGHYGYDPFLNRVEARGSFSDINPFTGSTKYSDDDSGLLFYGHRYYAPRIGSWLSRDPMTEGGGLGLYQFCGNAPITWFDPMGLALYAFDGTRNDGFVDDLTGTSTNVRILWSIYSGKSHYEAGVGTRDGLMNLLGMIGGYGGQDRLDRMMAKFREFYPTDKTIHVIGFSRGAALAREFVNRIADEYPCAPIQWVGLFDTVASFGLGGNDIDYGIRLGIPDNVQHLMHLTANHEYRSFFPLASIRRADTLSPRNSSWVELGLNGAHSDIGGGYEDHRGYANWSLAVMRWHGAATAGVPFGEIPELYQSYTDAMIHESRWAIDYLARPSVFNDRVVFHHP